MSEEHLKRVAPGVIENTDKKGYDLYVQQRRLKEDINGLNSRINNIETILGKITNMLEGLVKQ